MATRTKLPLEGVTVPEPCPVCGQRLTWHGRTWRLTCSGCGLAGGVTLTEEEAHEVAWYLAYPAIMNVPLETYLPALLAVHHLAAADVEADPQVISTRDGQGWKFRVLPSGEETPGERATRLEAQAALNGVVVRPANTALTEFHVSSQRRDAAGDPVCWYAVRVDYGRARCSCPAPNDTVCAHLAAAHAWLLEEQTREREVAWNSRKREGGASLQEAVQELCG